MSMYPFRSARTLKSFYGIDQFFPKYLSLLIIDIFNNKHIMNLENNIHR